MSPYPKSIRERQVFIDTAAFLALIDRNDSLHHRSISLLENLRVRRYRLVTTKYVIYESYAGILNAVGGDEARRFLEAWQTAPPGWLE